MKEPDTYELRSGRHFIQISRVGGFLKSWRVDGIEMMGRWRSSQGGETSGYVMMPVVGAISSSGSVFYEGSEYSPGKHGFVRGEGFSCRFDDNRLRFFFVHDRNAARRRYPVPFEMEIAYGFERGTARGESCLVIEVSIRNLGTQPMLYGTGLHPAFSLPIGGSLVRLETGLPEEKIVYRPKAGLLRPGSIGIDPFVDGLWSLSSSTFADDAFFFDFPSIPSEPIALRLVALEGRHEVRIEMSGWRGFGVWSQPGDRDFLCVEPINGLSLPRTEKPELKNLKNMAVLAPFELFRASMKLEAFIS